MILKKILNRCVKSLCSLMLLFPMTTYAHLISITATTPFPATVSATSNTTATFSVTNIAAEASVTVVDQSNFPSNTGLAISSNTCGNLLAPGQSCTIQVTLNAPSTGQVISSALKEWAKPSLDGVQFPINVTVTTGLPNITLVPVSSFKGQTALPALRDPIVAVDGNNWLIVSGSLGGFHNFNNGFNTSIYVYNPSTGQMFTSNIATSGIPVATQNQLASSDPEFLQDGDTLYIIGGFWTPDNTNWITLNTISAINVPGMINAVINGQTLAPYVTINSTVSQFRVTGGQLGKIGNNFYLAYGQDCEGNYCAASQHYTNSIYEFTTDPTLTTVTITNTATHADTDNSGWRRRDYTLAPFMVGTTETLLALAGPFTQGPNAFVWTNGINISANLSANDNFINQQANQYLSPHVVMYSASRNVSYVATFSGLSNLYWTPTGLAQNTTTVYGNILDLISSDASGNTQEFANMTPICSGQPVASCLYTGLSAEFVHADISTFDNRFILQLDQLPQNTPTLVGWVYGGLTSPVQEIFVTVDPTTVSNQVYAVYVTPAGTGAVNWKNITNLF